MTLNHANPRAFWDSRFAEIDSLYGQLPNAWLYECAISLPPHGGRVLCAAEGQGRNALWLARQGCEVHAVDISAVALEQLERRARQSGLPITCEQADLATWTAEPEGFDAALLIFAHFPPSVRRHVHAQAQRALKPRGWLVLEAFAREQLGLESGGPRNPSWLYSESMLKADFTGMQIAVLNETRIRLDEGPGHQGEAAVVRLLARRVDKPEA